MTIRLSTGLRTSMMGTQGFSEIFANGVIEIRSGSQPTNADSAATGTLLGTVTIAHGAFTPGTATNGLTWATPASGAVSKSTDLWQFVGLTTGNAGWFRLKGNALDTGALSTTLPRLDGSIGSTGADMNLSTLAISDNAVTTIDSFTVTFPAA